jgi:hypothetical protein
MHHHHTNVGLSVALLIIGLILLPSGAYLTWRVIQRSRGMGAAHSLHTLNINQGRAWGLPLFVALVGIILIVKGIVGL